MLQVNLQALKNPMKLLVANTFSLSRIFYVSVSNFRVLKNWYFRNYKLMLLSITVLGSLVQYTVFLKRV